MPRKLPEGCIPFKKGDPRTIEITKKGGAATAAKNAARRKAKEDLAILLKLSLKKGDLIDPDGVSALAELEGKNIPVQTAIDIAMVQRAIMGDVNAATWVRDTVGDKPSDRIELDQSLTIEEWAKNHKVKL